MKRCLYGFLFLKVMVFYSASACEYWLTDLPVTVPAVIRSWSDIRPFSVDTKANSGPTKQVYAPMKYPFLFTPPTKNPIDLERIEMHILGLRALAAVTLWEESSLLLELSDRAAERMVEKKLAFSMSEYSEQGLQFYRLYSKDLGAVDFSFVKYKYLRKIFYRFTFRTAQEGVDIAEQPWVVLSNEWLKDSTSETQADHIISHQNVFSYIQNSRRLQTSIRIQYPWEKIALLPDLIRAISIVKENLMIPGARHQINFMHQFENSISNHEKEIWYKARGFYRAWFKSQSKAKLSLDITWRKINEKLK